MYLSHIERVRKSPPNAAFHEWNLIPANLRNTETKQGFKSKLRSLVKKFFDKVWRYEQQFTNEAVDDIYAALQQHNL